MVPVVATGVLSSPVPGIWRRLSLISSDGSVNGLDSDRLVGQLEELGIPRNQLGLVHLLQSWQRARVPPDVAFALWLLRDQEQKQGCLYRKAAFPVEESSPAIRYIQLAAEVGERRDTDPTLHRVVAWLLDRQLPDGSIPLIISFGHGETGQTSRSLRVLSRLSDPSLDEHLDAMCAYLRNSVIKQPVGHAWAYSRLDRTVVTGSTSLAVLALIERGARDETVTEGLRYLMAAQDMSGGWAEVPGYRPTVHNTHNAVRAIRAGQAAGLRMEQAESILDRARQWFLMTLHHHTPRSTLELSFAVRLGVELDLLRLERIEDLARQLTRRRQQTLSPGADLYAETEISAIALLECSRRLDELPDAPRSWEWRWQLPTVPPPFLGRGAYLYELLYTIVKKRWSLRVVDAIVEAKIIERVATLLLGTITALGIANDQVISALSGRGGLRPDLTIVIVGILLLLWLAVKTTALSSALLAAYTSIASLGVAILLTWMLFTADMPLAAVVSITGLRWLVIDVVAYAADSSGLLDRLIPKNS
jgi:hypothetical protein